MKKDIKVMFAKNIVADFSDVLLVGLEEEEELFPYSIACINFIYELKEKGINATLNNFNEIIRSELYEECKRYLVR